MYFCTTKSVKMSLNLTQYVYQGNWKFCVGFLTFNFVRVTSSNLFHMWKKTAQRMTTGPARLVLPVKRGEKLLK